MSQNLPAEPEAPSGARASGASAPVRLLVAGDLHIGRMAARVPPGESALGIEAVLSSTADLALSLGVDALVLTGDLADVGNKAFEAAGVLDRLFRRLADAGLPVVAVAGDHDFDALAGIADRAGSDRVGSPLVHVLGVGQTWETLPLKRDGAEVLRLVGWSFAGPHAAESPLATFPGDLGPGVPVVGVLHGDVDAADSRFAPVSLAALQSAPVSAWLVGHRHAASVVRGDGALVVSPGSLQPLGPDETGVHGAMLVTVWGNGTATAEAVPLATLHYGDVEVDLAEATTAAEARALCAAALREHAAAVREASPAVLRAVVTLRLVGRTAAFAAVDALAAELRTDGDTAHAGLTVSVARVESSAAPDLDLGRLSAGSGAVATLARLSARLGTQGPLDESAMSAADRALVTRTADAVRAARGARVFETLAADGRLDGDLRDEAVGRLRRQVSRLLGAALVQAD